MNMKEVVLFSVFLRAPGSHQLSGKSFIWEANRSPDGCLQGGLQDKHYFSEGVFHPGWQSLFSSALLLAGSQGKHKKKHRKKGKRIWIPFLLLHAVRSITNLIIQERMQDHLEIKINILILSDMIWTNVIKVLNYRYFPVNAQHSSHVFSVFSNNSFTRLWEQQI